MYWYYVMNGLVLCGVPLSLENNERIRRYIQLLYFPFVLLTLAMFVGLRSSSPDYGTYSDWFDWIRSGSLVALDWEKDPAFVITGYIVSAFGLSFTALTLFFAAAALVSQFYFTKLASDQRWVTLLFYLIVCRTFAASDMGSMRSAVAIPLMSSSILLAFRGKKKIALLLYIASLAFHVSVLIGLLPFVLAMLNVRLRTRWWILSLVPFAVFAKLLLQNAIVLMSFYDRTFVYSEGFMAGKDPPGAYFGYIAARILLLALIMIVCWNTITSEDRLALFCYSIGIMIQLVFISNNAVSWRGSDVFCLFDLYVLMIPLKPLRGSYRVSYVALLVFLGLAFFYFGLNILGPYRCVFA
jgi:hypothetical protein